MRMYLHPKPVVNAMCHHLFISRIVKMQMSYEDKCDENG